MWETFWEIAPLDMNKKKANYNAISYAQQAKSGRHLIVYGIAHWFTHRLVNGKLDLSWIACAIKDTNTIQSQINATEPNGRLTAMLINCQQDSKLEMLVYASKMQAGAMRVVCANAYQILLLILLPVDAKTLRPG